MSRRDLTCAALSGLITGSLVGLIGLLRPGLLPAWLAASALVLCPLSFVAGMALATLLGHRWSVMLQLGRFVAVGLVTTALDFSLMNTAMVVLDFASGPLFSICKTGTFSVCLFNSYLWNKHWTFEAGRSGLGQRELVRFTLVRFGVMTLDVGIASLLVNGIGAPDAIPPAVWANIGVASGSFTSMVGNFLGQRFVVFRSRTSPGTTP